MKLPQPVPPILTKAPPDDDEGKIRTDESLEIYIGKSSLDCRVMIEGREVEGVTEIEVPPIRKDMLTQVRLTFIASKLIVRPGIYRVAAEDD